MKRVSQKNRKNHQPTAGQRKGNRVGRWFGFGVYLTVTLMASFQSVAGSIQQQAEFRDIPVDAARSPWFDAKKSRLKSLSEMGYPILLESGNKSQEHANATPVPPPSSFYVNMKKWFNAFSTLFLGFSNWAIVLILFLVLVTIGIVVYLIYKYGNLSNWTYSNSSPAGRRKRKLKIEDLPFEMEGRSLEPEGLWVLAQRMRAEGNFRLALVYLYSHLLVTFDREELLILRKGKTSRSYLAELRKQPNERSVFISVMNTFEKSFFGNVPLGVEEVDRVFASYTEIQSS